MKPIAKYGGILAGIILIAFGIGSTFMGVSGRSDVRESLRAEQIVGTPDMDKSIANKPIDSGAKAKLFAAGIRKHTLEATDGQLYSQMGQFLTPAGKETSDKAAAATDPKSGQPVPNAARNVWVTETALGTALNTSYFAERVATFAIVMGAAMLLIGIGFLVLVFRLPLETAADATGTRRKVVKTKATAPSVA